MNFNKMRWLTYLMFILSPIVCWSQRNIVESTLPYTLSFERMPYSVSAEQTRTRCLKEPTEQSPPCLHSFVLAAVDKKVNGSWQPTNTQWLVVGGRINGLHGFLPPSDTHSNLNFPLNKANKHMWVIEPQTGESWSFDLAQLSNPFLADALQSTNQQGYYDRKTKQMYIIGGYGQDRQKNEMVTFNTIIRLPVEPVIAAIVTRQTADSKEKVRLTQQIESLIEISKDDRLAVTGGELEKFNNRFYLIFGNLFMGEYHHFDLGHFRQKYTEEIRVFTLKPNALKILSYGVLTSDDPAQPFHRRDLSVVESFDPQTGQARLSAFGGVFQVGKMAGFSHPVHITANNQALEDQRGIQHFNQYTCPVIVVYQTAMKRFSPYSPIGNQNIVYHHFFGGITQYYYHPKWQTLMMDNELPFSNRITTFLQTEEGHYTESVLQPIPNFRFLGTNATFVLNSMLIEENKVYENGVINLNQIHERTHIGYIYGGIESDAPQSNVTWASNTAFKVYLNPTLGQYSLK